MTEISGSVVVSAFRRTHLPFAAYSLCLVAVNIPALGAMLDLSRRSPTDSHILLVPVISLVLMYQRRDAIVAAARPAVPAGAAVILLGIGLAALGRMHQTSGGRDDALSVMALALVVLWVGGFLLFYGGEACRAVLFPLLFLAFMIPMPNALLDGATLALKTGSREVVSGLFTLTGTPYHREGFVFSLPTVAIEIADECSGIRSSIALLLTTLLAGHMFLKTSWKKAVLLAAVLPMVVIKNGIRIVSLTLLAVHVDPGFLTGQLHHEGGFVFFLIAVALLAPVLAILCRSELARSKEA
jgi:exosortase